VSYVKPDSKKDYALILGASSGFGEVTAVELSKIGFNILGVHLDRGSGLIKVFFHSLAFGSLAPFIHRDPKERLSAKQMDMTLNVMAHSLVYWSRELLDADLLARGTKIYAMTSSGSARVTPYYGAVSAAKAALESHNRQLALELAPYEITVNCIRAGVTFTPALRKIPGHETMIDQALSQIPFKRLTQPLDIAKFIVA